MIDIPTTLQQVTVLSVKLVLHENIPTIFAYTASGQVFFVTLEDQVICKKNLFSSLDDIHYPVTSCMLYSHQNPSHVLKCIVTTMNHGLYHCIIELKKMEEFYPMIPKNHWHHRFKIYFRIRVLKKVLK